MTIQLRTFLRGLSGRAVPVLLGSLMLFLSHADPCAAQAASARDSAAVSQGGPAPASYPSAQAASQALFRAVRSGDLGAIRQVLGGSDDLLRSEDQATEQRERAQFAQKYEQMHRLARQIDGTVLLYIGAENWPFPIPIAQSNGTWSFNAAAGLREVLFRRIGENEMTAIDLCRALPEARHPATQDPVTRGPGQSGSADSLLASVLATSEAGKPVRFHGYDFRVLENSGDRFQAVAYPAEYRSSGVMTFIVNRHGIVYEKDLGPRTAQVAGSMKPFRRDGTWVRSQTAPAE